MSSKPKIALYFATSGHSGVDRAMKHLIPELAGRGYPIDLLHVRKHGPYLDSVPANVNIIDLGTRHVYTSLPAVVRYLKKYQPAVLLSDKDRVNRTAMIARALAGGKTRMILSSGTTISIDLQNRDFLERWLQRNSMRYIYPHADNIIVTSAGVADDMAAYTGLAREKIEVVPSPVIPATLFTATLERPDHPWFHDQGPPLILGVGELCARKDFATLLRAIVLVRQQRPCRLLVLGRGKLKDELQHLAHRLGIADAVDFAGFVDNPYAYMAHADLFAFTSQWEGLGFVIIEALAVGTPVVATDCPSGPREILQDGRVGELVPVGDSASLAAGIIRTLDKPLPKPILQQAAAQYEISHSATAYLQAMGLLPR